MTLTEILPIAQKLSFADKLSLIRILAEELDPAAALDATLVEGHVYPIYTPLEQYGAAQSLLDAFPDVYFPGAPPAPPISAA
jgi:hypothetical protein